MTFLANVVFFGIGFILGAGAALLYVQYKMYSQVGKVEEQMESLMELDQEMLGEIENEEE